MRLDAPTQTPLSVPRFGAAPWDVRLAQNQLLSRVAIESVGYIPWRIGLARNQFERLEILLNIGSYWLLGLALPIALESLFNKRFSARLIREHGLKAGSKPLSIPFELIEANAVAAMKTAPQQAFEQLAPYGFKTLKQFEKLVPTIRKAKAGIMLADLLALAIKGQVYYFGKNWLTEKLSGKKGFSGVFSQASDEYLKLKSATYERQKKQRFLISSVLGFGSSLLLPALTLAALKSPAAAGKGLLGKVKQLFPKLNYHNTVYMSKWVLLWQSIFNYNLPKFLSTRDSNELRETLTRTLAFDFFFFVGDDIFSGLMAKALQHRHKAQLEGIDIYKSFRTVSILGRQLEIPAPVGFHKIFEKVGEHHPAFRDARLAFWVGMAATSACLGVTLPLLNIWYTRKKVAEEQRALGLLPKTQTTQEFRAHSAFQNSLPLSQPLPSALRPPPALLGFTPVIIPTGYSRLQPAHVPQTPRQA